MSQAPAPRPTPVGDPQSRRHMIAQSAQALCALAVVGPRMRPEKPSLPGGGGSITATRAIHFELDFGASPQRLYEALLDAKQFAAFSGGRAATIDRAVGGAFMLFGGPIAGRNVELVPNHRIVQAWRAVDWPAGVYSIARFELQESGSGTRLVFDHTGFPSEKAEHLESGWQENYWTPLQRYLA